MGGKTTRSSKTRAVSKSIDIDKLTKEVFNDLYGYLGLDALGVDEETAYKIIFEILDMLYSEQSTKPKLDAILKKINRFREQVNMVIASRLLEEVSEPSVEQLEFIVYNGGKAVVPEISRIYSLLKKHGRADLIDYLTYVWERYGYVTPVKCPKCGFRAVSPDFSCSVCGYVVSEDYVRKELGFSDKFRDYVVNASIAELREVLQIGYVLLSSDGVYSPFLRHKLVFDRKIFYPIYLKSGEYNLIYEEMGRRVIEI